MTKVTEGWGENPEVKQVFVGVGRLTRVELGTGGFSVRRPWMNGPL